MLLFTYCITVWPELWCEDTLEDCLKICHLVDFTLAVEPVLGHNDIHNKMANRVHWEFNRSRSYIVWAQLERN